MSQKSSVPQAVSFVSQVLKRENHWIKRLHSHAPPNTELGIQSGRYRTASGGL